MNTDAPSPSTELEPHPDTVLVDELHDGETSPGERDSSRVLSSTKWHGALRATGYLIVSYVLLYPILISPVVADDYINPFSQADAGGPSLLDALRHAWKGTTEGASFRPLGGIVGSTTTWLMLTLSTTFDIGMSTLYAMLKFILIVLSAISIAWFWNQFSALIGRRVAMFEALVFVSIALFSTLQIHAYWSNDPVANYPLVGFGATALGFLFLGFVMRFVRLPSAGSAIIAAVAALAAVSYYELNVSAVMGASLILALSTIRAWPNRDLRWRVLLGSVTIVIVPALFILAGRTVTGDQSQNYGGTTVRLGSEAVRTLGLGLASSLPGAAWRLSIETLGGTLGIVSFAVGVTVLLGWIGGGWIRLRRGPDGPDSPSTRDPWLAVVLIAAMATYWFVAVAIQAITVKVQDETLRLGFVYTSYSVGAGVIALGLAVGARSIGGERRLNGVLPVAAAVALCFVLVQQTVNWRLSEQLNASLVPNRQLLASFDGDATPPERCKALFDWTSGGWPDYYEDDMIEGLEVAYEYYFGEPFCDGFVRPP